MNETVVMHREEYRTLLRMLNDGIYQYAEHNGIDLDDTEKLIQTCSTMNKIKLDSEVIDFLLDGIMHYDVGDQRVLKFLDLEGISFAGRNVRRVDFRGTNANVDPQTVEYQNIEGADFEGIDMSDKCFDGCLIFDTNLSYTKATFDPQKIDDKDLKGSKFDGLDLSQADFTDVCVEYVSFKNAKIDLDPQTVWNKSLRGTNLENVDMSGKDFSGCDLSNCNLKNTNAVLYLRSLDTNNLWSCNLQGTTLFVGEDFNRWDLEKQGNVLGEVRLDNYSLAKRKILSLFETLGQN